MYRNYAVELIKHNGVSDQTLDEAKTLFPQYICKLAIELSLQQIWPCAVWVTK